VGLLDRLRRLLRGRPAGPSAPLSAPLSTADVPGDEGPTPASTGTDGTPLVLLDHGLTAAVEALAAAQPVPVTLGLDVPAGLSAAVEQAAYRAVATHLADVVAAGSSRASVVATYDDGVLHIEVGDDAYGVRTTDLPTRP
jgi:hypothetical protein